MVAEMEPVYETLDALTLEVAEPMRTLMDTFSDIYSCSDFADNQYAKAKEFHSAVQANAVSFADLAYQYMDAISVMGRERTEEEEQSMLENGRLSVITPATPSRWHAKFSMSAMPRTCTTTTSRPLT